MRLLVTDDDAKQRKSIIERLRRAAPRCGVSSPRGSSSSARRSCVFTTTSARTQQQRVSDLLREVDAERELVTPATPDDES